MDTSITNIKIVKSTEYLTIEKRINEHLIEGWKLRGNLIVVTIPPGAIFYHQVMIKVIPKE